MTHTKKNDGQLELRRRAEQHLAARSLQSGQDERTNADLSRLVHELEVHQIELEMQNDELRAARAELELALQRSTELFDFAPIGYVVVNPEGIIQAVNLAAARMLGRQRRDLIGRAFLMCVQPQHHAVFRTFLARAITADEADAAAETSELPLSAFEAEPFEAKLTATLHRSTPAVALIAIEDITARKRAETALQSESRRKDEFLAMLSHELRNPLTPIRNSLFVIERSAPGSVQKRNAIAVVERQVDHLTRIVDDLLDITRIAHGKMRMQRARLELGDVVQRTVEDHRSGFDASGVELALQLGAEPLWIDADITRLIQVIGNLLANALKFAPRGARVEVQLRREGALAVLRVRDTGAGIAPEVLAQVFEPFALGPQSLDRSRGGLGLGLAMVKGLVELHGGTVGVTSAGVGHGTEFIVRLPLAPGAVQAAEPSKVAPEPHQRVLVIDDNQDIGESLRDVLALQGHDVQLAVDGPSGLALARSTRPDVIICDIGLPGMDGYEVARAIRADDALKGTYLIALSGYALPNDLERATAAGFDRHIAKPPRVQQLRRLREAQC